ncbi:MAG: protein pufQ [Rhodobacteraceae bacterium]|nr:protein pufQ [Paracoccaceae bacterium]
MADYTVNAPRPRNERAQNWEYRLYFSVIFALALATGLLTWSWRVVTTGKLPRLGPVGRALADAHVIAPIVFRS